MKKIKREEIQPILLKILKQLKKYCNKNDIKFFLIGGTLLGAIRHKGFIPWDDDIDVGMKRDEYDKIIQLAKKNPYIDKNKRYKILLPLDKNHIYPFIKIIDTHTIAYEKYLKKEFATGLWLDIFPYDYGSNTKEESIKLNKRQKRYKMFLQIGISGELSFAQKIKKMIAYPIYRILTRGNYRYWVKKLLQLPSTKPTKYMGNIVWMVAERDMCPKEWYDEYTEVTFEKEKYNTIKHYDDWLTQFYGDYMTLPKEEDRIIHDADCYYIDKEDINEKN